MLKYILYRKTTKLEKNYCCTPLPRIITIFSEESSQVSISRSHSIWISIKQSQRKAREKEYHSEYKSRQYQEIG